MDDQNVAIKNKGVLILLNRMDSHPEEFTERRNLGARTRWDWLIEQVTRRVFNGHKGDSNYRLDLPFLTDAEVDALYDKYQQTQGQAFTNRIMSELLDEPEAAMLDDTLRAKQMELFALQTQRRADKAPPKKLIVPQSMLEAAQRLLNSQHDSQP